MYVYHNVKLLKTMSNYCTKICDLFNNYVHHGYFHMFQEVMYMRLILSSWKVDVLFVIKYANRLRIKSTMARSIYIRKIEIHTSDLLLDL